MVLQFLHAHAGQGKETTEYDTALSIYQYLYARVTAGDAAAFPIPNMAAGQGKRGNWRPCLPIQIARWE